MSNTLPGSGSTGRVLLSLVVLAFALVIAGLWYATEGRRAAPHSPAPRAARPEHTEPAEPRPARAAETPEGPRPHEATELEPFLPARTSDSADDGRRGSLRGHVEVTGEEPFPSRWRLSLAPSTTLAGRETAVTRTLELDGGRQDFEVDDLPLGAYDISAEAAGFNARVLPVRLEAGSEHPFVNLQMVPAGILEGRLLDSEGQPAEGVPVTLFTTSDNSSREAWSDVRGVYRFDGLPDGAYEILVGRASSPLQRERRPLRFVAPHMTFPDIELPVLGAIRLLVVDSLARPLEGVEVRGSGSEGGVIEGRTDGQGVLVVRHLPRGRFRIRLVHPGFGEKYERRIALEVEPEACAEATVRLGP